jgi:hypothetical protein
VLKTEQDTKISPISRDLYQNSTEDLQVLYKHNTVEKWHKKLLLVSKEAVLYNAFFRNKQLFIPKLLVHIATTTRMIFP